MDVPTLNTFLSPMFTVTTVWNTGEPGDIYPCPYTVFVINPFLFSYSGEMAESSMSGSNSLSLPAPAKRLCSQWTQTECTFPSVLPLDVERVLSGYFSFKDDQSSQPRVVLAPAISTVINSTQQVKWVFTVFRLPKLI